jgi:phosphoglycolate phosphatase-like HAD superfamily hydrolase
VFVTDTLGDVMEAHQAGVKSIGVLWGLHDRTTLERGKPEVIIDDPSQLEETVERVLNG